MIRIVVVLPEPFAPRNPVIRPGRTSNDTPSSTRWSPKLRLTVVTFNMRRSYGAGARARASGARPTPGVLRAAYPVPGATIPFS